MRLRPARRPDRAFAEGLYLGTMLPLLRALGQGDPEQVRMRFARGYSRDRSRIICSGEADVGWMQVSPIATGFHLDQLHLLPEWRNGGIGSAVLRRLFTRAARTGSEVELDVIYGNPAIALYRRLGFAITGSDEEKHRMTWQPARALPAGTNP